MGPGPSGAAVIGGRCLERETWCIDVSQEVLDARNDDRVPFCLRGYILAHAKDANLVRVRHEPLSRKHLNRYVSQTRDVHIYRAAAKLWGAGVNWTEALSIATDAFEAGD